MRKSTIFGLTAGLALSAGLVFAAQNNAPATHDAETEGPSEVSYVLNPTPGFVDDLSAITVTFTTPEGIFVGYYGQTTVAVLEDAEGNTWVCDEPFKDTFAPQGQAIYTLEFKEDAMAPENATITAPGIYTLTLKGFYTNTIVDGEETDPVDLDVATFSYTIYPVEYALAPANGSYVTSLAAISASFEGTVAVGSVKLENVETSEVYTGTVEGSTENNMSEYTFNFDLPETLAEGAYTLTIDGITEGTTDLPAIVANYNYVAPVAYSITPAEGVVEDLSTITIHFDASTVAFYSGARAVAVLENLDNEDEVYYCYDPTDNGFDANGERSYTFDFREDPQAQPVEIKSLGSYKLTVVGAYMDIVDEDVTLGTVNLPVIEAYYNLIPNGLISFNPADGATVTEISTIELTIDAMFAGVEDNARIILTNVSNNETYQGEAMMRKGAEGESIFDITFTANGGEGAATITEVGDYELSATGFFVNAAENAEDPEVIIPLPMLSAQFKLIPGGFITFDPADGSRVESLSAVRATIAGRVGFEDVYPAPVRIENAATGMTYYCVNPQLVGYEYDEEGDMPYSVYEFQFAEIGSEEFVTLNEVGTYTITVSGAYQNLNNDPEGEEEKGYLPVFTASFNLIPEGFVTISPENGSNVAMINAVTVLFEGRVGYEPVMPGNAILENTSTGNSYYCTEPFMEGYQYDEETGDVFTLYTIEFSEMGSNEALTIDEVGNYILTLRGFFSQQSENEAEVEPYFLPVIETAYTIIPSGFVTFDPEAGTTVDDLSQLTVTFEGRVGFTEARPGAVTIENTTTGEAYYCQNPEFLGYDYDEANDQVYTKYNVVFSELGSTDPVEIKNAGNYTVSLRGFYSNESEDEADATPYYLPVITVHYSIYADGAYTLTPADGAEVESINSVTLVFNGNPNVGVYDVRPGSAVLENLTTGDVWYGNALKTRLEDGSSQLYFTFSQLGAEEEDEITTIGTYQLTVRGLYETELQEDETEVDTDMPNVYATYYVVNDYSGVQNLFGEESVYNVYGINGVQMIRNGNADSLKSLAPGLYIINGKKVLIRR